ncbi:recombination-associated protein RdgC [Hydrogenophaga sp.]|uniref:recombination-associated protein RdgC n=1 Tax=Hydrogenophaga sp. TaxID=1904254 RepID=UPI0019911CE7|nr:recombination-associated protein RdgC [Hydrogenophaga sp.]MBD3894223.1 recombination-associated protein RdgC [Hydrogenophaga sp.]
MFKNVTIYRLPPGWAPALPELEAALQAAAFQACGATQDKSVGWIAPRGQAHGALVESVAGQRILQLQIETKSVPGSVLRDKAQQAADEIEARSGRKPGKKELKALREDALLALLPQAFARQMQVWVWIDPENGWLVTDASSQGKADEVISALVRACDGLSLDLLQTQLSPQSAMAQWLLASSANEWPSGFVVERECELKSSDEEKSTVKFTRHPLLTDEVRQHISEGKLPTRLALSWEGRIGLLLSESLQLKKITFLDGVFDDRPMDSESGFDTDVALATGELRQLIPALLQALGGPLSLGAAAPIESAKPGPTVTPQTAPRVAAHTTPDDDGPPF